MRPEMAACEAEGAAEGGESRNLVHLRKTASRDQSWPQREARGQSHPKPLEFRSNHRSP